MPSNKNILNESFERNNIRLTNNQRMNNNENRNIKRGNSFNRKDEHNRKRKDPLGDNNYLEQKNNMKKSFENNKSNYNNLYQNNANVANIKTNLKYNTINNYNNNSNGISSKYNDGQQMQINYRPKIENNNHNVRMSFTNTKDMNEQNKISIKNLGKKNLFKENPPENENDIMEDINNCKIKLEEMLNFKENKEKNNY